MKLVKISDRILNEKYGVTLEEDHTLFKVWSPESAEIKLCIYDEHNDIRRKTRTMKKNEDGIWTYKSNKSLEGKYYTYLVDGKYEIIDPYVQSTNANSSKGMIVDASKVYPEGFLEHKIPEPLKFTESILYELHIKDFSMQESSEFKYKGKYLAFTEKGLTHKGQKIGIDHLIELGVTHVHLLPVFDFITVNDYKMEDYNWGYDPYLFNSLEGSYSTYPENGSVRILEFKKLVMALHEAGIRVVLDVVYNHTYFGGDSNFNRLLPNVFHRSSKHVLFTNGSGCGNELDTEHDFVRKFIVNSLKFWLETYKVDGFRFDLMSLYDVDTMKLIEKELKAIRSDVILYGEPWVGGDSSLPHERQFTKGNQNHGSIALFNDDFRNAIKGNNDGEEAGFVGGDKYKKNDVYAGCFGSISFSNNILGFASDACETVNYVSSHDNLILMDKFSKAFPFSGFEDKQNMNALALSMVLLSFGIPFIQAGTEFLRSKHGHHNTYNASNKINRINWTYKRNNRHVFDYVKKLIEFRKSQKVLSTIDPTEIKNMVHIKNSPHHVVMYEIKSLHEGDFESVIIAFNGGYSDAELDLHSTDYKVHIDGALYFEHASKIHGNKLHLPKLSSVVCVMK